MAKLTLNDLTNLENEVAAVGAINLNNSLIETALENTLSRSGTTPNVMNSILDMNSFTITNLPIPVNPTDAARLVDIGNAAGYATAAAASATSAANSATAASTSATSAATSATSALGYVNGLSGASTTSTLIGTGAKTVTASTGKLWAVGQFLTLSSNANSANFMHGTVTSYNSSTGSLVMNILDIGGSGTFADWNIAISGPQGSVGSTGPSGAVGVTGSPTANQFATWNSGTVIQGVSITGLVKGNGASAPTAAVANTDYQGLIGTISGIAKGNGANALTAATAGTDYMHPGTTSLITVGYSVTPNNLGTITTGTTTPTMAGGNYQYYTNNGAHTLAAPAADGAIDILITNGASAGSITFSGFTVSAGNTGDALTTTNTNKFIVSIRRINTVSTYIIKALQ